MGAFSEEVGFEFWPASQDVFGIGGRCGVKLAGGFSARRVARGIPAGEVAETYDGKGGTAERGFNGIEGREKIGRSSSWMKHRWDCDVCARCPHCRSRRKRIGWRMKMVNFSSWSS